MSSKAQVALAKCSSYEPAELESVVAGLLDALGGIGSFVRPGQRVLIKPNLLTDRVPDQAATTHPELVRVLIRAVKALGALPFVADSPGSAVKLERVWEKTGFRALCERENVPLVNLEQAGSTQFDSGGFSFNIAKPVLEADAIINMPKVKTHVLTVLTGAVKNMYGAVPGYQKTVLHARHPSADEFGMLLAEVYMRVKPCLNIADGVVGMAGDGPSAGRPVRLGFIAASPDGVALDLALCRILGIKPRLVPYLRRFLDEDRSGYYRSVEIDGEDAARIMTAPFRLPSTLMPRLIPGPLVKAMRRFVWIRPAVSDNCTGCLRCVAACPVAAMVRPDASLTKSGVNRPHVDAAKCIGCCCCHEVCPEDAIRMVRSPLLRLVCGGKME